MPRVGSTFYSQIGKMAVPIVVRKFADGMKYLRIRAAGYTFYSQNTLLAVLIEASGCKKCSHFLLINLTRKHKYVKFCCILKVI